ncbi:MAG: hypothetical protein GYA87_08230 [Christensenellaceae bacterium]|nr:hypothetical protein [Christensenellaceae bacterium]
MKSKPIVSLILAICLFLIPLTAPSESLELSNEQQNAIAMLNYITVLTQEINSSKNSRLYLEQVYSSLINNTYPNSVDSRTQNQLTGLLDTMENYRMINVKRERLDFIFDQNQAQAIRAAVPNPLGFLSSIQSYRPSKLVSAIVYMAIDSISSYTAFTEQSNLKYINDSWALDDEESAELHNSRKGTFVYMISMVRDNNLPGDLILTENAVEELVSWKNNDNIIGRIRFLETNKPTYQSYGSYWLILAESYYSNGDFEKCLNAISSYESVKTRIFRRDYEYAKIIPLAIAAAYEVYLNEEYEAFASRYAQAILDNSDHDDWSLRYFAAQTFVDLYGKTQNKQYLKRAYEITLDNVNYLVEEQRKLNANYISAVQEISPPTYATKDEKEQISNYNKMLKETRKTELPPIYEPLLLNCELLFALADKLNISESDQLNIEGILHLKGEPIFLIEELDNNYWFIQDNKKANISIDFAGTKITIPVTCVTDNAVINVTVKDPNANTVTINDWYLEKVERPGEGNISTYYATYISNEARNYMWLPDSIVSINIIPKNNHNTKSYKFEYKTEGTKNEWYDYLKIWEGHKANWYDYAKVWENSVVFKPLEKVE